MFTRIAVHVIVERKGRILLGMRKNAFGEGEWGLPTGHLEFNERLVDCAGRELLEETGLVAEGFEFVTIGTTHPGVSDTGQETQRHYVAVGFKALGVKGEAMTMEPGKCFEWKWFEKNNLPTPMFYSSKPILENYFNNNRFFPVVCSD